MKRFKIAFVSLACAGILFAIYSFATRTTSKIESARIVPDKIFQFTSSGATDRHDPTKYMQVDDAPTGYSTTPPLNEVVYINVKNSQVYTQAEADASSTDAITNAWVGKPKVDQTVANTLDNGISTAISNGANQTDGSTYDVFLKHI